MIIICKHVHTKKYVKRILSFGYVYAQSLVRQVHTILVNEKKRNYRLPAVELNLLCIRLHKYVRCPAAFFRHFTSGNQMKFDLF